MKFEVKRNGITLMQTNHPECIPDPETLKLLLKAGYRLYMDGRAWRPC